MVEKHFILTFLWSLFCVLHSLLASVRIKQKLSGTMGKSFKHYRLFYTFLAFITLGIVVYYQLKMESPLLFTPYLFTNISGWLIGAAGLIIMGV
ncbi:MAG: hypothetical protein ACO1NX_09710, partial [Chitinophagaceae bacterium]